MRTRNYSIVRSLGIRFGSANVKSAFPVVKDAGHVPSDRDSTLCETVPMKARHVGAGVAYSSSIRSSEDLFSATTQERIERVPKPRMKRIPDFHEEMDRFQNHIPTWISHNLKRLRGERAIWVRVPTGVALMGGGVLGFLPLPIVGIWMLPVGLALLAHDIQTMRRPMARLLNFANRQIEKWKS